MPVFAASALRPFTVRAASSSLSVVRMPSDFSLEAAKDGRPSISEIGYVMTLNMKDALSELAEARRPCDGFFSHSIIDAGLYGQPPNQFVHIAPPSAGYVPDPCLSNLS